MGDNGGTTTGGGGGPNLNEAEVIEDNEVIEAQNKERPHATTTPRGAVVTRAAVRLWPRVRSCAHYTANGAAFVAFGARAWP